MNSLIYFCAVILPWILSGGLVVYFFVATCLRRQGNKIVALRLVVLSFLSAILAWFIASLIKYNFPSPRPFEVYQNLKPLFTTYHGDSFPSGHATFMGALAMGVFLQNGFDRFDKLTAGKLTVSKMFFGLLFIIGAILVAVARVLANVHWPIDVIFGLLFGFLISLSIFVIYQKLAKKKEIK